MSIEPTDLEYLFEKALQGVQDGQLEESGQVISVGDGICRVYGLTNVVYGERVECEGGNAGIVFDLASDYVTIFLLYLTIPVKEFELVKRTGTVFKVPVSMGFLGRVVNALAEPIDDLGEISAEQVRATEQPIVEIIDRTPIDTPLATGITVVDALVPIGRGQRELLIGNRNTGKTSMAIDAIINQKDSGVLCIYVAIAQRQANVARIVQTLAQYGALSYTTVISADASQAVLNHYLSPYVGCTLAEYWQSQGHDVLVVYDDLSNHAVAFREMSLLMRRAPGREAFPGDVFYLHSRLLERAGRFKAGGSITALPIVQIQSDDITAYVPTNLISITDGQVFFDTKLFNKGVRPAVNVELSVSRVGGAAQTKLMKKMTRALRLELAQYHELLDFAQFGTELDEVSQRKLARGNRIVEVLKQGQSQPLGFVDQALALFLVQDGVLDHVAVEHVREFVKQFVSLVRALHESLYLSLEQENDIVQEQRRELRLIADEFSKLFVAQEG